MSLGMICSWWVVFNFNLKKNQHRLKINLFCGEVKVAYLHTVMIRCLTIFRDPLFVDVTVMSAQHVIVLWIWGRSIILILIYTIGDRFSCISVKLCPKYMTSELCSFLLIPTELIGVFIYPYSGSANLTTQ